MSVKITLAVFWGTVLACAAALSNIEYFCSVLGLLGYVSALFAVVLAQNVVLPLAWRRSAELPSIRKAYRRLSLEYQYVCASI